MQITQITGEDQNMITGYGRDHVAVNGVRHTTSLILRPDAILRSWPVADATVLQTGDLSWIREHPPEILLLGTGTRQVFPPRAIWRELRMEPWGLEIMDTAAACRTYNLIVAEGRTVAAALIVGS
ncbi:Mth938-like domain-containing protein [Thioalkalivibrio sp.]|uniref:Mth938-like domain-containing protein n=1 Tax=Thioalkalivibrio sp. TaxID=2093813 RepID=UPI003567086A